MFPWELVHRETEKRADSDFVPGLDVMLCGCICIEAILHLSDPDIVLAFVDYVSAELLVKGSGFSDICFVVDVANSTNDLLLVVHFFPWRAPLRKVWWLGEGKCRRIWDVFHGWYVGCVIRAIHLCLFVDEGLCGIDGNGNEGFFWSTERKTLFIVFVSLVA